MKKCYRSTRDLGAGHPRCHNEGVEGETQRHRTLQNKKMIESTPWLIAAGQDCAFHSQRLASPDPLTRMAAGNGLAVAREWLSQARNSVRALEACFALPSD